MKLSVIIVLFSLATIFALDEGKWTEMRVTFGDFDRLPIVLDAAKAENFTELDNQCLLSNPLFQGVRVWKERDHITKENDSAVILLFDGQGFIAGIQTAVPSRKWTTISSKMLNTYVVNDTDHNLLTLTVYFVDPATICKGRDAKTFQEQGIGTDLYIQVGSNWTKTSIVPKTMDEAKKTLWGHGKCYYQMGQHFWYNTTITMPCDYFVPYCTMYNRGKLNAFCFAINSFLTSRRYEHPDPEEMQDFMEPVPDCFSTPGNGFVYPSSMHVYLTPDIVDDKC